MVNLFVYLYTVVLEYTQIDFITESSKEESDRNSEVIENRGPSSLKKQR